jgi:IstB-like ATP binding protein
MLPHPTLDQLRAMKLDGMAQAFVELEAQDEVRNLAHAEWLALLLDREAANRNTKRFQTRLRSARLRHSQAAIEDVDYRTPRRLDKAARRPRASFDGAAPLRIRGTGAECARVRFFRQTPPGHWPAPACTSPRRPTGRLPARRRHGDR